jgi:hypothetical protein
MSIRCGLLAGAIVLALSSAGCGDDDEDEAAKPATTSAPTTQPAPARLRPGDCCRRLQASPGTRARVSANPLAETEARPRGQTNRLPQPESRRDRIHRCGDVPFQRGSDNGAFDVATINITCGAATRLLFSRIGLRPWSCAIVNRRRGAERWLCLRRRQAIAFTLFG